MASAKDIKKKIRTISNTKKITRTMEMVATVKSKRGQDRLKAMLPASDMLFEMLRNLKLSGTVSHPLLGRTEAATGPWETGAEARGRSRAPQRMVEVGKSPTTLVLVVSGNRGLCGGYNANVLTLAERFLEAQAAAGRKTEVHMVGKKGISRFRFRKIPMAKSIATIGDNPTLGDAEELLRTFVDRFLAGEVGRVVVIATRYLSSSVQKPIEFQLLPLAILPPKAELTLGAAPAPRQGLEFIYVPDMKDVLEALVPLVVKVVLFRMLVEARTSEHVARRVAMKMATDNAEQMIHTFTTRYNRQRQAGITKQIMEVVGGAQALE